MTIRPHAVRIVFAASVILSAFWILGLASDIALGHDIPMPLLLPLAMGVAMAICTISLRRGRMSLRASTSMRALVIALVPKLILSYLGLAVAVGLLTWSALRFASASPAHPENGLVVGLLALWLPLWLAPAAAAEWWWRSERHELANDASQETPSK